MWKLWVNMAEGRNCRKSVGGRLERRIIKYLPKAWELAVTRLRTDAVHDLHIERSFFLGITYRRVKTQSSLQGTALHITVRATYSYRCALPRYGNSALLQ
jgi:hypothetical protein